MRNITTEELKFLFKKVIDKLEQEGSTSIKIENDFYRFIPTDSWDNYEDIILAGSLYDDLDCLKLIIKESNRPLTYVDFDRLASILRAISEIQNPSVD